MVFGSLPFNFVVSSLVSSCFRKFLVIAGKKAMESSVQQATKLLKRLNEAERRAKLLQLEIKDIRKQIATLTQSTNAILLANGTSGANVALASTSGTTNVSNGAAKRGNDQTDNSGAPKRARHDLRMEGEFVVVYTDGACENNGKPNAKAGIGVWFGDNNSLNISKPVLGRATNNTAEIQAPCEALKVLKSLGYTKVKIVTDSKFTIDCMTKWIQNWKKKNWRLASGGPVKNKEDLVVLDNLISQFAEVKWEHIAGHQGHHGNEEADKLARAGALSYKPS